MILILELIAAAGTLASVAYYIVCLWCAAAFLRKKKTATSGTARGLPVSILKPLKGTDPEMYESFRSHCLQNYLNYELIFGVNDATDPVVELVERLKQEFPDRAIRLILCSPGAGANRKIVNLSQMMEVARHEIVIVNDSDIRVAPDYLQRVTLPLTDQTIGLVTCLYRGIANRSIGSKLESLGISTDFAAGVLVAKKLEGIKFGLGSTLAFRRRDLEAIGGFEPLADYLADDYQLGARIAAKGLKGELSDVVVDTFLPEYTTQQFIDHQLRWARTVRDSRFWGYVGLGFTFGLPWALLGLALSDGAGWAWALLAAAFILRVLVASLVGQSVLDDRQLSSFLYLLPVRDIVAFFVWIASFTGHTIHWRGEVFQLRDGKLVRKESAE
ncbi:MAG TPA: bacteriohopanetetrol glucosamine biosynthesis glycosyltransferase HpnI [Terriglobales bacterium]